MGNCRSHQTRARFDHLIDPVMQQFDLGISEPIAAGSARLWTDSARRGLVLIVDAGAGTTDFALFLVNRDLKALRPSL